jgi:hypothetical protein
MKNLSRILLFLLACAITVRCTSDKPENVIIENDNFRYEVDNGGKNLCFVDKVTGKDYLFKDTVSYCASVNKDGREFAVTGVSSKGKKIRLQFGETGIVAELAVTGKNDFINIRVTAIEGEPGSLTFMNVPLTLEGVPDEPFAACVLSMNLFTHVRQLPALQTHLWACCYRRFGIKGAEISLIGVPGKNILPVIRGIMKNASDVPFSDKGGAWALPGKDGYGSYLMDFGSLTESTVDDAIEKCKMLGFNQLMLHGGGFFKHGELEPDRKKWPEGWENFKRINNRLHESGISSILLTYTFFIDKSSRYVTPVPSEDLGYFSSYTLTEPMDTIANEIIVRESTAGISTVTGYFVRNSNTLRLGEELIEFSGVTASPPYKFTGCKRGVCGTGISTHEVNSRAFHLKEMFGLLVPDPETPLFTEIAGHTAEIVDKCGFDGIYFDAIDGNDLLAGKENAWYYGTKFIFEVAKRLKKPVGMEMCDMPHHYWHYSSRWQAWDRPVRGYKRFIDVHLAAIKSLEHRHGEWMGHTPVIDKLAAGENGCLLLPLHLGWWSNYTWNPPQVEPTFTDDVEYLCCKMIGNDAGLSMLGGLDTLTLNEHPVFRRLNGKIRQYEELRHNNYFSDSVRAVLRQPGKEFILYCDDNGRWNFRPAAWKKHKITGTGHPSSAWTINNEFGRQDVKLRLELLMSVKPYDDPENILLTGLPSDFLVHGQAKGIKGEITASSVKPGAPGNTISFSAYSSGLVQREGSWIKTEKNFKPWLDLHNNQALGVWINGDNCGELLNLRIESPEHLSMGARGDHFIKIDFDGWRYFELVETESSEFNNYIWPDEYFNVYNSYFYTVRFNTVDKLQLWYNNLPPGKEVSCMIGPVKALPMVSNIITSPSIKIGGEKIIFPVRMESGMYLEFYSAGDCKLYSAAGKLLKEVKTEGRIPVIEPGENEILFSCEGPAAMNSRVQVTVLGEGEPLLNR